MYFIVMLVQVTQYDTRSGRTRPLMVDVPDTIASTAKLVSVIVECYGPLVLVIGSYKDREALEWASNVPGGPRKAYLNVIQQLVE